MSSSLVCIDIIYIRMQVFIERSIISHRYFHRDIISLSFHEDNIHYPLSVSIDEFYKFLQSSFRVESFAFKFSVFLFYSFICKSDGNSFIKKSQLAKTRRQSIIIIY